MRLCWLIHVQVHLGGIDRSIFYSRELTHLEGVVDVYPAGCRVSFEEPGGKQVKSSGAEQSISIRGDQL